MQVRRLDVAAFPLAARDPEQAQKPVGAVGLPRLLIVFEGPEGDVGHLDDLGQLAGRISHVQAEVFDRLRQLVDLVDARLFQADRQARVAALDLLHQRGDRVGDHRADDVNTAHPDGQREHERRGNQGLDLVGEGQQILAPHNPDQGPAVRLKGGIAVVKLKILHTAVDMLPPAVRRLDLIDAAIDGGLAQLGLLLLFIELLKDRPAAHRIVKAQPAAVVHRHEIRTHLVGAYLVIGHLPSQVVHRDFDPQHPVGLALMHQRHRIGDDLDVLLAQAERLAPVAQILPADLGMVDRRPEGLVIKAALALLGGEGEIRVPPGVHRDSQALGDGRGRALDHDVGVVGGAVLRVLVAQVEPGITVLPLLLAQVLPAAQHDERPGDRGTAHEVDDVVRHRFEDLVGKLAAEADILDPAVLLAQDGAHVRVDGLHRIAEVAPALDHLVLQVVLAAQDPLVEDIVGVVVELVHRAAP